MPSAISLDVLPGVGVVVGEGVVGVRVGTGGAPAIPLFRTKGRKTLDPVDAIGTLGLLEDGGPGVAKVGIETTRNVTKLNRATRIVRLNLPNLGPFT